MTVSTDSIQTFKNLAAINQTSGTATFQSLSSSTTLPPEKLLTTDLGAFNATGGVVVMRDKFELDNRGATLLIGGTSQWYLEGGATITGGTIQIAPTAALRIGGNNPAAVLKDVTVNGNMYGGFAQLALVGDLDFNGNVADVRSLQLGHDSLYADVPLVIRGGSFTFAVSSIAIPITGTTGVPSVTLEADVILKGNRVDATFTQPLTNRGQIIADSAFGLTNLFHITAAPITNEGTLSAIKGGLLRIANLAAPNSGIVSAAAGSTVEFTNTFAQASTGTTRFELGGTAADKFGLVAVTGAAALAGTLEIQFAPGYVPVAGDRYKVLTYASHIGTFSSVRVLGLAAGLVVTPQYNGSDMTLVISAG